MSAASQGACRDREPTARCAGEDRLLAPAGLPAGYPAADRDGQVSGQLKDGKIVAADVQVAATPPFKEPLGRMSMPPDAPDGQLAVGIWNMYTISRTTCGVFRGARCVADYHLALGRRLGQWLLVTHPRCANCHVDAGGIPIWTLAGQKEDRVNGMNIYGGVSRIGAEAIACSACHMTSTQPNAPAPAPPHAGIPWQLAPVEFLWYGPIGTDICKQLRDPARNGGRDAVGLLDHLRHDASLSGFIPRAWEPGEGVASRLEPLRTT